MLIAWIEALGCTRRIAERDCTCRFCSLLDSFTLVGTAVAIATNPEEFECELCVMHGLEASPTNEPLSI